MGRRSNIKMRDVFGTIISVGVVVAFFVSAAPVVSYGEDRLLVKDNSDATKFVVTDTGYLGVGTGVPVRQVHVAGDNAVFRMDRTKDAVSFLLVRTSANGTPLKAYAVGATASGVNRGEFMIDDLGAKVSGGGSRRMTIQNDGNVVFTGSVTAANHLTPSSRTLKDNVKTYENALETVKKLRGVSFNWKDSGKPSVGLIAEEVEDVVPEVVAHDGKTVTGVNYSSLVGVLVEAVKEQQGLIKEQQAELKEQKVLIQAQQRAIQDLQEQQKSTAALSMKVTELERLLILSNAVSKAD